MARQYRRATGAHSGLDGDFVGLLFGNKGTGFGDHKETLNP